jgi:hypothetical protein
VNFFGGPRSKKGDIKNILFIGIVLFVVGVVAVVTLLLVSSFNDMWAASPDVPQVSKDAIQDVTSGLPGWIDKAILVLLFGLAFAGIVSSAIILLHPVMSVVYAIALLIITLVCAVLSNAYQDFAATPAISGYASQFTITTHVIGWLPVFVFFFGIVSGIVMFKLRSVMSA